MEYQNIYFCLIRMNVKKCCLCKTQQANKPNSHIIPKFMSKRLFEASNPRHTVQLHRNGKHVILQDTPKENNLLCFECEKRFEILETYFSRVLIEINSLTNAKRKYTVTKQYDNEIIVCDDLHPSLFKLFIYSIIWRCSVSSLFIFETFKLNPIIAEEIRTFLNTNLYLLHSELMLSLDTVEKLPQYHTCLIKPKNRSRGIFTAYEFGENAYAILTVDYALFFYTTTIPLVEKHILFSNIGTEKIRIVNGNDDDWKNLNNLIVTKMLKSKHSI